MRYPESILQNEKHKIHSDKYLLKNTKVEISVTAGLFEYIYISKVGNLSHGRPEGSLFNSYYTEE